MVKLATLKKLNAFTIQWKRLETDSHTQIPPTWQKIIDP